MNSVHGVVILADQRYEAPLIQAIQGRSDVLAIVRRCADLAEVVAAARAGLADLAVIDGSDPDLTIETVESLRGCGMVVVALAPHHERSRLIALGVASVAAPGSPDQVVNSLIAATRSRRSTPATASSAPPPPPPPAAPEAPSIRPSAAPPVAPPPASPTYSDDDETPRRSGGGMKWALGLLALVIAGCAAGGYYYYDHYLAAPAPTEEKAMARPDTTPAKPAPVADNEAEMREKVITYWDVYAKRSSGLIIQYSNAQLRKMLEAKGFALKTDHSADNASAEGEAQPEQSQVYELTTNKGEVLCRFVLNNDRVYNELWFKYPEDKAAFVKGAAASGFKAGTSADRETKVPTYYSSFASDSVRTYPNTRHDYIVAGNETLKLCRERER